MARQILFAFLIMLCVLSPTHGLTERKVLFYEVQAPANMRITGAGYSLFNSRIGEISGFRTASMTSGSITRDKLQPYDVIIMQNLERPLSTEEILAIRWYVGENGGGLFINGNEPAGVNNLGQIFGVMMDTEQTYIVDTSSPISDMTEIPAEQQKYYFRTTNFPDTADPQTIDLEGVTMIGVYKAHPLFVESVSVQSLIGNTRVIASAGSKAYTETGTFSVSEEPPIAARAFFGKGAVVVLADFDILSNERINDVDDFNKTLGNADFGLAVVKWLADPKNRDLTAKSPSELQKQMIDLQREQKNLLAEKEKLESDKAELQRIYDANFTIFSEEQKRMDKIIQERNLETLTIQNELEACNFQKAGGIFVTVVVLLAIGGFFIKRKLDEQKGANPQNLSEMFGKPKAGAKPKEDEKKPKEDEKNLAEKKGKKKPAEPKSPEKP